MACKYRIVHLIGAPPVDMSNVLTRLEEGVLQIGRFVIPFSKAHNRVLLGCHNIWMHVHTLSTDSQPDVYVYKMLAYPKTFFAKAMPSMRATGVRLTLSVTSPTA